MKLKTALEIGQECGLSDIGEAIYNIQLHAMNIFTYGEEISEYKELCDDYKECREQYGFSFDTNILEALEILK